MPMVAAIMCGLIFGWGLLISGMVQPAKVLGFLDTFGAWNPSLAVVMAAALAVSSVGFKFAASRNHPILAAQCEWPTRTGIDRPLVIGAVLFGTGWGLVGLCPGPALENFATLSPRVVVFVVAMACGMILHRIWVKRHTGSSADRGFRRWLITLSAFFEMRREDPRLHGKRGDSL